jgi:hypothetical protein
MSPRASGGAAPSKIGGAQEHDIEIALGALPGVTVWRNAIIRTRTASGAHLLTGIGGKGAPDLLCEVQGPDGQTRAVWLESKAGSGRLSPDQKRWHEAAAREGRHAFVVRSVDHALEIVQTFRGVRHG